LIASTHLAAGAATGLMVQKYLAPDASSPVRLLCSFAVGFVSHLILDALPHKDYSIHGLKLWAILFLEISLIFVLVLSFKNSLPLNLIIFFGMAGGALPDVMWLLNDNLLHWSWLGNLSKINHLTHFRSKSYSGFVFNFYIQVILATIIAFLVRIKSAH
jgi:hypothetical protein